MRTRRKPSPRDAPRRRRRARLSAATGAVALLLLAVLAWRFFKPLPKAGTAPTAAVHAPTPPVVPAPRPASTVAFSDGCVTAECHGSLAPGPGVHAPDAEQACETCHAPDAGDHTYPLVSSPDALCAGCHDTARDALVQHSAMTLDGCLACHDPHAPANPALLVAATVGETCDECHTPALGASSHPPYAEGDCSACHDPHGADVAALLRGGADADHCAMCHRDTVEWMATARHAHRDIEGSCLACHGPHATAHPSLMTAGTRATCTPCHADVGQAVSTALVSHDPVLTGDECLSCHAPHASDQPTMLRDEQTAICLSCHAEAVTGRDGRAIPAMTEALATAAGRHGPVAAGNCSACHSVHGAAHARLLQQINPGVLSGRFDVRNYALCFSCHSQDLALADTPTATQFRHGDRNLHKIHAQPGGRARGCADCHAVHASHQPRLVADRVAYEGSDWLMEMGFVLTDDGGTCSPGCHEPLGYSRAAAPEPSQNEGGAP